MITIANDAKNEFLKDKEEALDWGTDAIDEQAHIERDENGVAISKDDVAKASDESSEPEESGEDAEPASSD